MALTRKIMDKAMTIPTFSMTKVKVINDDNVCRIFFRKASD